MPRSHRLPMCCKVVCLFLDLKTVQIYCKYDICKIYAYSAKISVSWNSYTANFFANFRSKIVFSHSPDSCVHKITIGFTLSRFSKQWEYTLSLFTTNLTQMVNKWNETNKQYKILSNCNKLKILHTTNIKKT